MPSSPSQLTQLLAQLENAFPAARGHTQVVFENEVMPISDLAIGLDSEESISDQIVAHASALGISQASALLGVRVARSSVPPSGVGSLTYLGSVEISES